MLINLSNHPFATWPEEQVQAALAMFGEVADLAFPQISPQATSEQVCQLAQDYLHQIQAQHAPADTAIHIMGEMTFTYQLVKMLKEAGYKCYASTTVRDVIEVEPGKKTTIFHFAQFREY